MAKRSAADEAFFGLLKELFLQTFLLDRDTVNEQYYQALLSDWLRPAIHSNSPGLLQKGVIFLNSSAPPCNWPNRQFKKGRDKLELLQHSPYSPDLDPSNFHLFGWQSKSLRDIKFKNDEDVLQQNVQQISTGANKKLNPTSSSRLVEQCEHCSELQGEYVEK